MKEVSDLVDALYSRFLLRDVFGKVVPGVIVILAFLFGLFSPHDILRTLSEIPLIAWPVLYGATWVAGFAVQQIPELFERSHTHDKKKYDHEGLSFHEHLRAVRNAMSQNHDHQQLERFIVIKEATGNAFWAVLVAPLLLLLSARPSLSVIAQQWSPFLEEYWTLFSVWGGTTYFLHRQHNSALKNQDGYMETVVPISSLVKAVPSKQGDGPKGAEPGKAPSNPTYMDASRETRETP